MAELRQIRHVSTHASRQIYIHISDVDAMRMESSYVMFQPARLSLQYRRVDDDPWELDSVQISGPKLKKDGSQSTRWGRYSWWERENSPEWVQKLIDDYMPPSSERIDQ